MVSSCWKQLAKWSGVSCQMNTVKQTFHVCYMFLLWSPDLLCARRCLLCWTSALHKDQCWR